MTSSTDESSMDWLVLTSSSFFNNIITFFSTSHTSLQLPASKPPRFPTTTNTRLTDLQIHIDFTGFQIVVQKKMSFQDLQGGAGRRTASNSARNVKQNSSQAVAAGIFQINTAVAGFKRLVDSIGTVKDTPDHRQKLHNMRQSVLQLVKETSAKLKAISESDRSSNVNPSKRVEDAKLARDFQTVLQEFQKVQQLASERESTYAPSVPPSSIPEDEQSGSSVGQESRPFMGSQKRQELVLLDNEISFNDAMIDEREQGIREIQEQIGEASEIFKDLAVLVHEQGVTIDDIHSNIESSSSATNQARTQLVKASKSGRSRSSWCWWVLGIFIVAVVVIVLVLVL